MSTATAFSPVTLNQLEEHRKGPVWAINTTKGKLRGQLVISVPASGGKASEVVLPLTWIPINLTGQTSRKYLLASNNFRNSVSRGLLRLVSEEEAQHVLAQSGGAEEQEKVARFRLGSIDAPNHVDAGAEFDQVQVKDTMEAQGLSAAVYNLVETMKDNSPIEVLNTMRNMGELSRDEYRAIYIRAKEVRYKEVSEFCKTQAGGSLKESK